MTSVLWKIIKLLKSKNIAIGNQKVIIENSKIDLERLNNSLEDRIRIRTAELSKANQELTNKNREITEALFRGQSIERKRVATELHDNLGGTLSAIKWRLEAINRDNFNEKENKVYDSILGMMQNAYTEVRNISHNFLPSEFEKYGLIGALQKLFNEINEDDRLSITFNLTTSDFQLSNNVSLEIYSVLMELLNNVLKYAHATKVIFTIRQVNTNLIISVEDNGIGIDLNLNLNLNTGYGMGFKNIKERLDAINGFFEISSKKGAGTTINIILQEIFIE